MKKTLIIFSILFCSNLSAALYASESHDHNHSADSAHEDDHEQKHAADEKHEDDEHGHDEDDTHDSKKDGNHDEGEGHDEEVVSQISDDMAMQVGIVIDQAGPQTLHQTSTSFGRLTTAPEHTSHVRARFPGIVRTVEVNIGDTVSTGDLLAVIESNESLKRYEVRAPINGTVIQRHANAGEMTQDQVLFSITNFDSLWAELRIFPTQQKFLSIGQPVHILAGDQRVDSRISHMLPADDASPYLIARAKISGKNGDWFPGLMVEGAIVVDEFETALAVKKTALQILDGRTGIFVKEQNGYRFTALVLGRSDDVFSEVLSGVQANIEYVTANSYLIKADIEKSEAEHEH